MNTLGEKLKLTSYGESHGESVGAVLDGFPSNFSPDLAFIQKQLDRRKPGQSHLSTARKEEDLFKITSGLFEGKTTGAPIHFSIKNKDSRPEDYDHLKEVYRPSHADFTYEKKYGHRDHRGGGRSSARITAPWVAAGAMALDYLKSQGIEIYSYVAQVGDLSMEGFFPEIDPKSIDASFLRCPDSELAEHMSVLIEEAKAEKDSLGGIIACQVHGVDAGIGDPVFSKLNAKLAHAMFSINAVKGFDLGGGFDMVSKRGSEVNDAFSFDQKKHRTSSNFSGGIQGGISNGMPIFFRVAFKPTATIGRPQNTTDKEGNAITLEASGRHDPCVLPRAVPIVDAMTALVILDAML
ncbi:chorismate synthase [bacterium]|nr:chorismate synthase [bacterium]